MNITLNDEESREYLDMKDGKVVYEDVQRFLDFLDEMAFRLTPIVQRLCYRDGDNYHKEVISWENAHEVIRSEHNYLQKKLDSIAMKYRKEQNNGNQ